LTKILDIDNVIFQIYKSCNIFANFEDTKMVGLILKISKPGVFDIRCLNLNTTIFVFTKKMPHGSKSSLNSYVYWDTLYYKLILFLWFERLMFTLPPPLNNVYSWFYILTLMGGLCGYKTKRLLTQCKIEICCFVYKRTTSLVFSLFLVKNSLPFVSFFSYPLPIPPFNSPPPLPSHLYPSLVPPSPTFPFVSFFSSPLPYPPICILFISILPNPPYPAICILF